MVLTCNQYKNMSKEELIEQCVSHDDIANKLSGLTKKFDKFCDKYESLRSELKSTQNCKSLFLEHSYQLERNAGSNSQYHRRKTLEINPLPLIIQDTVLEEIVCHTLSLTGMYVTPDQLHSSHWLNKKDPVIVKFKCRKHRISSTIVKIYRVKGWI